jgi:hypothetical protein
MRHLAISHETKCIFVQETNFITRFMYLPIESIRKATKEID